MKNKTILAIAGAAVLFLLGLVIGLAAGGPSVRDIQAAVGERIDAATAAQSERIATLEAGMGEIRTDLAGRFEGLASGVDAGHQAIAGVGAEVKGLGEALAGTVQTAAADQLAALETGLAGLRGQIAAPAPADDAAPAEAEAAPAAAAAAPENGFSPGQTAVLSDGAVRVFVSRIDAAAGTAAVRIGGADSVLALGESRMVAGADGECRLTLDAVGGNRAGFSAACGDALPAPDGAAPGAVVALADGLRVFVSAVTDGGARIAINGVQTETVAVGEAVEVTVGEQTCQVSVTGVDRGRVALGYSCG